MTARQQCSPQHAEHPVTDSVRGYLEDGKLPAQEHLHFAMPRIPANYPLTFSAAHNVEKPYIKSPMI